MEVALIDDGDRLFHAAGRHGDRLQDLAALIAIAWSEGFLLANHLIEIVDDGAAVIERLTTIDDERGNAHHRIDLHHGGMENRQPVALEAQVIVVQRHRNPAHERRVILADEDHETGPSSASRTSINSLLPRTSKACSILERLVA